METIEQTASTQEEADHEKTSENPLISTSLEDNTKANEESSCSPMVKAEPQDEETILVRNEIEMTPPKETEESRDLAENLRNIETSMEIDEGIVKQEPENDEVPIDKDMPIAKDSNYINGNQFATPVPTEDFQDKDMPIAKDSNYINGNQFATPVPTDDFQDGIATAVAPAKASRLRVKSEFSLRENLATQETSVKSLAARDYLDSYTPNEETPPVPPPPSLSAKSTSDILLDGIATPRISLLALNRLKVKTEVSQTDNNEDETSAFPTEFFNESPKEAGEVSNSNSDTDSEGIPPDFFDDLLPDLLTESADNELEEKYSERLKEKERLKNAYKASMLKSEDKRRHHKKKKSKKKSKKRLRSRSPVHSRNNKERSISPCSYSKENKRSRRLSNSEDISPFSKEYHQNEKFKKSHSLWVPENFIRVKKEFEKSEEHKTAQVSTHLEKCEEFNEILTPKQKRERAIKRATALLNHLRNSSSSDNFITSTFQFVSTVRKLPTSHFYVQQRMYENRSPLYKINNVKYKFNSHATRFNLEEWGLASLTTHAAKMAKLIGCNAQFIYDKLKTIKIPAKLKKVKKENMELDKEEEEELVESRSSLFCNAMTQTDNDIECNTLHKGKGYDIGVQAQPIVYSIGSQTLETQSPSDNIHKDDEAPIMNIIRDLNENQLMAIHSFAELIKQSEPNTNAMDMYKIQMKIMEIYKISQIPSALATSNIQGANNYTTTYSSPGRKRESTQPVPIIQSVKGADGMQFSINDPRMNYSSYAGRVINNNNDGVSSSNADPRFSRLERGNTNSYYRNFRSSANEGRHSNTHPMHSSSSNYRQHQQTDINQQPPTVSATTKRYGRGALRRV